MLIMFRIVVIVLSLLIVNEASALSTTCEKHSCVAVIDAGSTGSRLHVFAYDLNTYNQPAHIQEIWSKRIKPGLSSINPNKESISAYLSILLNDAPERHLPVYFYATAGMRLLSKPQQQLIYGIIHQWFSDQSEWALLDAKTITGREEGVFGWLSVNYQLGAFENAKKPLVGVMDMGGASVQITFPVDKDDAILASDKAKIQVGSRQLTLYVHSFLGLGQTVMAHQFLDVPSCFSMGYILPNELTGEGDVAGCRQNITKLINDVHNVNDVMRGPMSHSIVSTWDTIGGNASLAKSPLFHFNGKTFTTQGLLDQADNQICHHQWQDLYNQYPTIDSLYEHCLFSAYYYALMVDGYGISSQQPIQYSSNEQDIDWSLGVVLQQH